MCAKNYRNYGSDTEFLSDIRRVRYLKKLFTRYNSSGDLKMRLILTHLTILSNVFGREFLAKIIWLKLRDTLPQIKPFMVALGLDIRYILGVEGENYQFDDVQLDPTIIKLLRDIKTQGTDE
jgi:hypothetical protein